MARNALRNHYEQIAEMFAAGGMAVDAQTLRYLAPLLKGDVSLEEHEALLLSILERIKHGEG